MEITLTLAELNAAFDKAEGETHDRFQGKLCSAETVDGIQTCPICDFRKRVRVALFGETS